MKLSVIYSLSLVTFCYFLLLGLSSGPTSSVGDRTLSPVSGGGCDGCHANPGDFVPFTTISLKDSTGVVITNGLYKPGHRYSLNITVVANDVNSITPIYGAQTVLLTNSNTSAGSLSNPTTGINSTGTDAKITSFGGRAYLEHSDANASGVFNATWIAPPAGTGPVSIYSMGLAVNDNGAFTGDNQSNNSLILQEDLSVGIDKITTELLNFSIYPNPSVHQIITLDGLQGDANIQITNALGSLLYQKELFISKQEVLDLSFLPKGLCFIRIELAKKVGTKALYLD